MIMKNENMIKTNMALIVHHHFALFANHPWLTEILAPNVGPGSDITNEGLKLQTIGGQWLGAGWFHLVGAGWGLPICLAKILVRYEFLCNDDKCIT